MYVKEEKALEPPMTVRELSEYLRLDRMTIYKMLKEGSIPASRIGHQWRFFRADIDEWIRSLRIGQRVSVLVVDSDQAVRQLFDTELPSEAFDVVTMSNADEAAALVTQRQFDVAFLELKKSALEAFRRIRATSENTQVVIIAGTMDGKLFDQAMEIGPFTLMKRPTSGADIRSTLSTLPLKKNAVL